MRVNKPYVFQKKVSMQVSLRLHGQSQSTKLKLLYCKKTATFAGDTYRCSRKKKSWI